MYIPRFALREKERVILSSYLTRQVNVSLKENITAYVIDENQFEQIIEFVSKFREGEGFNEAKQAPSSIPNTNRAGIIRAVTTVFNLMVDAQKIKNEDIKTATMASILSATMSIFTLSPEYGQRLISIIKSKI